MIKLLKLIMPLVVLVGCQSSSETKNNWQGKTKRTTLSFAPKVTGRIEKIFVQEGDVVQPGDTLAYINVPEVTAKKAQVEGVLKSASAQLSMAQNGATGNQLLQLQAKQTAIQEQFNFAEKSYQRAKAMFADSMMTPQSFDEATAKYLGAKAQLAAVNAELDEAQKGVRYEQVMAAKGQQEQAKGALQEVNVASSERYIIATNTMQIETIALQVGELATAGYPLFNGYIPQSLYFRFTLPEMHIGQYEVGQKMKVNVPYKNTAVESEIVQIKQLSRYADVTAAYPEMQLDEAMYEIKLKPVDATLSDRLLTNATVLLAK